MLRGIDRGCKKTETRQRVKSAISVYGERIDKRK